MIRLAQMSEQRFQAFFEYSVNSYAQNNVDVGRWVEDGAVERARADVQSILPAGRSTPDHWFFDLENERTLERVGFIWFAIVERGGMRGGYIYDFEVDEKHRRQGFARAALEQAELFGKELGLPFIDLHVFGFNTGARRLYETIGYTVESVNMRKLL